MPYNTSHRRFLARALCTVVLVMAALPAVAEAQTAATLYQRAQAREASARKNPTTANLRAAVAAYRPWSERAPEVELVVGIDWSSPA